MSSGVKAGGPVFLSALYVDRIFCISAKRAAPDGAALSLSKNLRLEKKSSVSQGEYEGAGVPSCGINCLQKDCTA